MSPNNAFVVIGVAKPSDGVERVWIDTVHSSFNRAQIRLRKLLQKVPQTAFEFSVVKTHFGHRVAPIYTNASTDSHGVPDLKAEPKVAAPVPAAPVAAKAQPKQLEVFVAPQAAARRVQPSGDTAQVAAQDAAQDMAAIPCDVKASVAEISQALVSNQQMITAALQRLLQNVA